MFTSPYTSLHLIPGGCFINVTGVHGVTKKCILNIRDSNLRKGC